jgi:hypothetical protein
MSAVSEKLLAAAKKLGCTDQAAADLVVNFAKEFSLNSLGKLRHGEGADAVKGKKYLREVMTKRMPTLFPEKLPAPKVKQSWPSSVFSDESPEGDKRRAAFIVSKGTKAAADAASRCNPPRSVSGRLLPQRG